MEKWMEDVCKRYPLDETQTEEKEVWESGEKMPFIVVDGKRHFYDNGHEYSVILDMIQDKKYADIVAKKNALNR